MRVPWRAAVGCLLLWAAFGWFWLVPLFRPRGLYLGGRYALSDLYLGLPIALAALGSLVLSLLPARLRRPVGFRYAAVCFSVLVSILVLDGAAAMWKAMRWDYWWDYHHVERNGNRHDPDLGWVRQPHLAWKGRDRGDGSVNWYRTDENGFRNPPSITRADLVFLGDSFTEAAEIRAEESFPSLVGAATRMPAVNLGRSGYGPPQELVVLRKYGLRYHPKAVVWQIYEGNDLVDAEHFHGWLTDRPAAVVHARPHGLAANYVAFSPLMWQLSKTWPPVIPDPSVRYPDGSLHVYRGAGKEEYANYATEKHPEGLRVTEESIAEGLRVCRANGIRLLVLFAPTRNRVYAPFLQYRRIGDEQRLIPGGPEERPTDFGPSLGRFCQGIGCPYVDLTAPFHAQAAQDIRRLYFLDDFHFDTAGHDLTARKVCEWLRAESDRIRQSTNR